MFGFNKKKVEEKKVVEKKEEKDEKSIRIDVEDLTEQGFTCEEIAQELGVDKERVYRIREARKRRTERMRSPEGSSQAEEDPLKALNIKIKEAELNSKLKEAEWNNKIKEIEMQQKIQELQYNNEDDGQDFQANFDVEQTPEDNFLKVLAPALMAKFMNPTPAAPAPAVVQVPLTSFSPAAEKEKGETVLASETAAEVLLTDEEVAINAAKIKSMIPKKYQMMLPLARDQINQFSDKDKIRMLNKILE